MKLYQDIQIFCGGYETFQLTGALALTDWLTRHGPHRIAPRSRLTCQCYHPSRYCRGIQRASTVRTCLRSGPGNREPNPRLLEKPTPPIPPIPGTKQTRPENPRGDRDPRIRTQKKKKKSTAQEQEYLKKDYLEKEYLKNKLGLEQEAR